MHRSLVQIDNDSQSGHKEQEEYNPELTYSALTSPSLPEHAYQPQKQRQAVEHIMSFVVFQFVRQLTLVAQSGVVYKRNAGNPIAMLQFTIALYVVLPTCKVPHKVSPVHKVALIREEETQVIELRRNFHRYYFPTTIVRNLGSVYAAQYIFVRLSIFLFVHSGEYHVLSIYIIALMIYHKIGVFLTFTVLLLTTVDRCTFFQTRTTLVSINIECHLRRIRRAV